MPLNLTSPEFPAGQMPVTAIGNGGFKIGPGDFTPGSLLLLPGHNQPWLVSSIDQVTCGDFDPVLNMKANLELLIVGCGEDIAAIPDFLSSAFISRGIGLEFMATATACRTYNLLLSQDRAIAAALIAID